MDRNKDGKLVMEEVEPCLIPGTYRYREFHKALKMSTPEAVMDSQAMPGFTGETAAGMFQHARHMSGLNMTKVRCQGSAKLP